MKLIGELKEKVEKAETKEDVRQLIKKAGILLDDEELDQVSGGKYGFDTSAHKSLSFAQEEEDSEIPEIPAVKTD